MWVGVGAADPLGWWLWLLMWVQSATGIVYVYLRLEQRGWAEDLSLLVRLRRAWRALTYVSFNLVVVSLFSTLGYLPALLFLPYGLQWAETLGGAVKPAVGVVPTACRAGLEPRSEPREIIPKRTKTVETRCRFGPAFLVS